MTSCREYQGARDPLGYGRRRRTVAARGDDSTTLLVHRQIVEMVGEDQFGTEWDPSLIVMHLCDNPPCFRYDHLRLATMADNSADMVVKGRDNPHHRHRTHCMNGHEYTPDNTYTHTREGSHRRVCRACAAHRQRRRRADLGIGGNGRYSKLTHGEVELIRAEYAAGSVTHRSLAEKYSVAHATVGRILRMEGWL